MWISISDRNFFTSLSSQRAHWILRNVIASLAFGAEWPSSIRNLAISSKNFVKQSLHASNLRSSACTCWVVSSLTAARALSVRSREVRDRDSSAKSARAPRVSDSEWIASLKSLMPAMKSDTDTPNGKTMVRPGVRWWLEPCWYVCCHSRMGESERDLIRLQSGSLVKKQGRMQWAGWLGAGLVTQLTLWRRKAEIVMSLLEATPRSVG